MRVSGNNHEAQCEGKKPYGSSGHAGDVLKRMVWRNADLDIFDFSIYPCRHCQCWHIGKTKFITYEMGPAENPIKKKEAKPEQRNDRPGQQVLLRKSKSSKRVILYYEKGF